MSNKPLPYSNKGDLTVGSVRGHLTRLTVPLIWGLFSVISMQLIDIYFISMLGTKELAGVSFTFPVTMAISHLVFGFNVALSSVISRMIGEKRQADARRIVSHALMMSVTISFVISLACYLSLEPLFMMLGADEASMPIILAYMPLWLVASVVLAIPVNGNSAIRATGDTLTPAIIMTSMAVINLILDPLLIFGLFGFPALGVQGAALATLIAYIPGLFLSLYILRYKKDMICRNGWHMDKFKDSFRRIIVIALPVGITNLIVPLTNAVIIALLATYGTHAVAAYGVVSRIEGFVMIIILAMSLGLSPIIGQNWGAKNYGRVHQAINLAIGFNFLWSLSVALVLGLFAKSIVGVFTDEPQVAFYAVLFFWIVPLSYAFSNLVYGWCSIFNAMGHPKRSFVMIVVKALILTIPAVFIGHYLYDVMGIFIAIAAVNITMGAAVHLLSWRACARYEALDD